MKVNSSRTYTEFIAVHKTALSIEYFVHEYENLLNLIPIVQIHARII